MSFVKLYSTILDSSIWLEPDHVLRVWIAMLALADPRGMVEASVNGLARRSNVSREVCEDALAKLSAPDPDSKTKEHEGRRIEAVPGGWFIFNYRAYRERGSSNERVKRHRAKTKAESVTGVTPVTPLSLSSSTGSTEKRGRGKTGVTRSNGGALHVGELVQQIRGLGQRTPQGLVVISKADVEKIGSPEARAFAAVGGSERFVKATGKDFSFLVREFGQALEAARDEVSP